MRLLRIFVFTFLIVFLWNTHSRLVRIEERFGGAEKLACNESAVHDLLAGSVVRIIGAASEGSGFPFTEHDIFTNFHVIDGEPSPKIVLPDGNIETPVRIVGSREQDVAILTVNRDLTPLSFYGVKGTSGSPANPKFGEAVFAGGYPFGSDLAGSVTVLKGAYGGARFAKEFNMNFIQTEISLNEGMSGGPLVDACGQVIGMNTMGVAGLSFFLDIIDLQRVAGSATSDEVTKVTIDKTTPKGVVEAFYMYIKVRDLGRAYPLIGPGKIGDMPYEEWVEGYANTLQVELVSIAADEAHDHKIHVKLASSDWVGGELIRKFYEGYWVVDENMKLNESNILEVANPDYKWYYSNQS